jgi:hypothetical protein
MQLETIKSEDDRVKIGPLLETRVLEEEANNPKIVSLAREVKDALLDGLDNTDGAYVTAMSRLIIIQRELAAAMRPFHNSERVKDEGILLRIPPAKWDPAFA